MSLKNNKISTQTYFNKNFFINYILKTNILQLSFYSNIPNSIILNNQKNFFFLLNSLNLSKINIIFFSKKIQANIVKSFNLKLNFNLKKKKKNYIFFILDNDITLGTLSKLSFYNSSLFFKSVNKYENLYTNIYPLFINLESTVNTYIYLNFLKIFFLKKKKINFKNSYNILHNLLYKNNF